MSRIDKVISEAKKIGENLNPRSYKDLAFDLESYLYGDFDDPTLSVKEHPQFDRLVLTLTDGGRPMGSVEVSINNANRVEYLNPKGVFQNKARQAMKDWDIHSWPKWIKNLAGSFENLQRRQTYERQRLIKSQNVGSSVVLKMVLDDEWDEYIIQFWKNGKHDERKDYFSGGNDASAKQDAERTMASMAKEIVQKGLDK